MQLLIVDDEEMVAEGLAWTLPWETVGMTSVHIAYSAAEALRLLETHPIDIVVTDIRMPEVSGLELLAEIYRRWRRTKCIVLSGFAEFDYAREAMASRAFAYLLKPVPDADLLQAVSGAAAAVREEWESAGSMRRAEQALREHRPLIRNLMLNDLLTGKRIAKDKLAERLLMLDVPFRIDDPCAVLVIRLEEQFAEHTPEHRGLFAYAIGNMAEEIFEETFGFWCATDSYENLVAIVVDPDKRWNLLERCAVHLQENVETYLKGWVSVIVSEPGTFPKDVRERYQSCINTLRRQVGPNRQSFLIAGEQPGGASIRALGRLYEPPGILALLEGGQWGAVAEKIETGLDELGEQFPDSAEHLAEAIHLLMSAFTHYSHKNGKWLSESSGASTLGDLQSIRTVSQLKRFAHDMLKRLRDDMDIEVRSHRSQIVRQVLVYVEKHLEHDVSLQAIADHVGLHPVSVSKIFKQEQGESLTETISRIRMEKASYLLKSTDERIYEIAAKLGYQNTPYFIKVFKKYFGLTPQEFRER
ncbi:response regulator [Paenibacillus thermotolerans]|uniref:response regulator n=1 Tax=Paenibacillus thermotolerans TaxID=3027807 RepID=UPI0023682901|nr:MULTISPECIES: response regulator [unclassified Paenibacillus]